MTDPNDPIHAMPEMLFPESLKDQVLKLHSKYGGLTKRELFAAMAMQGILSGIEFFSNSKIKTDGAPANLLLTELAVDTADALIVELNKEKKHGE